MNSNPKKLLLASHLFFVECAWRYLSEDKLFNLELIDVARNQEDIEKKVVFQRPDIIVFDIDSAGFNLKKTLAFVDITTQSKIILTGSLKDSGFYDEYRHLNIAGFITHSTSKMNIQDCVSNLGEKKIYFAEEIDLKKPSKDNSKDQNLPSIQDLGISEREVEIIKLISEGYINKEIAESLFISTHTVNTHRKNIMQKLGINNTAGIVLFAVKEGLVSPNEFLFSTGVKES
jgi:DNA-binding NarL/FixJ family response regulator